MYTDRIVEASANGGSKMRSEFYQMMGAGIFRRGLHFEFGGELVLNSNLHSEHLALTRRIVPVVV